MIENQHFMLSSVNVLSTVIEVVFKGQDLAYFDLIYHTDKDGKKRLQFVREREDVISRLALCVKSLQTQQLRSV